jgi:nucleoside-diphosphate-sugar epimerase
MVLCRCCVSISSSTTCWFLRCRQGRHSHHAGDGTPWRPLIHCKDIARAFVAFLEAPRAAIHNQSVQYRRRGEYQVRDVADIVRHLRPGASIVYTGEVGKDPRDYRVDFGKLSRLLPDFRLEYNLAAGMEGLLAQFYDHRFSTADFDGDQFVRLRTLRHRLDRLAISRSAEPHAAVAAKA